MITLTGLPRRRVAAVVALLIGSLILIVNQYQQRQLTEEKWSLAAGFESQDVTPADSHPISLLVRQADEVFALSVQNISASYVDVVSRYRQKYGRHPPPRFLHWFTFARGKNVYDFDAFDQIYEDLRPFWAINPANMRYFAAHAAGDWGYALAILKIRDGQMEATKHDRQVQSMMKMIEGFVQWLPDMDIPINIWGTPRILAPYEIVQGLIRSEEQSRELVPEEYVHQSFSKNMLDVQEPNEESWSDHPLAKPWNPDWSPSEQGIGPNLPPQTYQWQDFWTRPFRERAMIGCPPGSAARSVDAVREDMNLTYRSEVGGFVQDFLGASDICVHGENIEELHGMIASPSQMLVTPLVLPVFSEAKMSVNSDILIPSYRYYLESNNAYNEAQDRAWGRKYDRAFWRGDTGGAWSADQDYEHFRKMEWRKWHKQRLVAGTDAKSGLSPVETLSLPSAADAYTSTTFDPTAFARLHADTGFTSFRDCRPESDCSYYKAAFKLFSRASLSSWWRHKYLFDVDNAVLSGKFLALLQSRSLPIKSTIFREWHTKRLIPWRHFVPLSLSYTELWSLLIYFIGWKDGSINISGHDAVAAKIARQGHEWTQQVLRKEDMEVYVFRLLLEYGRIIDDRREWLGEVLADEESVG